MTSSRLARLSILGLAAVLSACGGSGASAPAPSGPGPISVETLCALDQPYRLGDLDLQTATVLDLQQALARGTLTSEALVTRQLALIEAYDRRGPALNSVRVLAPDALQQARAADARRRAGRARGPLDGLTVLLKDNIGTTDLPTTAGSIALAGNIPRREATITRRLREAGVIVLGKANLSEFANWVSRMMPNGYSSLGGQVLAPYGADLDPLGSSTGSSVAATMGFATLTVGSETSGSIIAPSSVQSAVGVKPTLGLVSRVGIIPLAPSFDTAGPITRTVTDAAALLQVLAYADPEDPLAARFTAALEGQAPDYLAALSTDALRGVRLGVRVVDLDPSLFGGPLFEQALEVLRQQGAEIVPIDDPALAAERASLSTLGAIFNEFKFSLNRYLATEAGPGLPVSDLTDIVLFNQQNPDTVKYGQELLIASDAQTGLEIDPVYLASREATIATQQLALDRLLDSQDVDALVSWYFGWSNVGQTAAAGYPNVTVPLGYLDDHEPVGLEFAGRPFSEDRLLAYAYAYEQASRRRVPALTMNPALRAACGR
ncbi:MAG TPA: amidase family protein [Solimonas sp.]|nr:amidase family protein [Solimonas sp.]